MENNQEKEKEIVRESAILSIVIFIYGIFMFLIGIFSGKKKSEADTLGKVLNRNEELKKEAEEVWPFDENLSKEEAVEYYNNLPEEEKEKFNKKLDEWHITVEKQVEILNFANRI